jgi:type IV pilus assembly protein PilQ
MGVQFQVGGDLIWIVDGKDTNKVQLETRFYRLRKGLVLPAQFGISDATKTTVKANNITTTTEVQKYENFVRDGAAKEPSIENAIRMFCGGLKYQLDLERNVIAARGTQQELEVLEKIIKEFDKPIQQVLIEARFITVEEPMFLQLGVAWETGRNSANTSRTATDYTGLAENVGLGYQESWYGVLGRASLSATLSAIDQSGESEVLSAPRVTLINNLPATISDGKIQYFYEQYTVTQQILANRSVSSLVPQGKPAKLTSGVTLDVLASVGGDGRSVMLALRPKVAQDVKLITFATITDRDDSGNISSSFDIKLPEKSEQSLATRVVVKSGQTVVMGGVSQREQRTFVESVPVLGNIPILGAAFRRRTEIDNPRYLLIFVTATLLSENGEYMVSADAE